MTDPAHLQAALDRLHARFAPGAFTEFSDADYRSLARDTALLLTSYAVLLARAEAAEAALTQIGMTVHASDDAEATLGFLAIQVPAYFAAHPQPQAPVMGGEGV